MRAKDALGIRGEQAAARYLAGLGWRILDRNWRSRDGELDIVAHDGRAIVVCEVKTRSGTAFGAPVEAITANKAARLVRLARSWATAHGIGTASIRVDIIGLLPDGRGGFTVDHLRGCAE